MVSRWAKVIKSENAKVKDYWQHIPEHINPIIFSIGPVEIRWYGVLYVMAFVVVYLLIAYRIKTEKLKCTKETIASLLVIGILVAVVGGRLGYVLFYNFDYFWEHPLKIFFPLEVRPEVRFTRLSGLSYHGSVIGILIGGIIIAKKYKLDFWYLGDIIISAIPLGYTLGRIGNFINGELYGRVTTSFWGMYFPLDPTHQLRHPSQLYEAFFEGIVLWIILWRLRKIKNVDGLLFGLYFIGYGLARFFIEFVREPDAEAGLVLGYFTTGQVLCGGMIVAGIFVLLIKAVKRKRGALN